MLLKDIDIHSLSNLGYCWVCNKENGLHEHHIIPQAYGGKNGPIVTLCGGCHTNVHSMGEKYIAMQTDYKTLLPKVITSTLHKNMLLCTYIVRSHALITKSKAMQAKKVTVNLTPRESELLLKLQKHLQCSSQEKVFKHLLLKATSSFTN